MSKNEIYGRKSEKEILNHILNSDRAELLAIYGRRRIGKTYLVNTFFENLNIPIFEVTGVRNSPTKIQIQSFCNVVQRKFGEKIKNRQNWQQVFDNFAEILKKKKNKNKLILFFDELPWLTTPRSLFLECLDYFWNHHISRMNHIKMIVCGSSASWMIKKIVSNKAGFHNRLTQKIHLQPFTLTETINYLKMNSIDLNDEQYIELYMIFGGVAKYLSLIPKGESVSSIINNLCFDHNGFLMDEFDNLYASLFEKHELHIRIVKLLSKYRYGLNQIELSKKLNISQGGWLTSILSELEKSNFIRSMPSFRKQKKEQVFILSDPYSHFYLKWIEPFQNSNLSNQNLWFKLKTKQAYAAWTGLAFESLIINNLDLIKNQLGITGILTKHSIWRSSKAQIDLLIERDDKTINLCEIKFTNSEKFNLTEINSEMEIKRNIFKETTQTKQLIINTLITNKPIAKPPKLDQINKILSISDSLSLM